MPPGGGEAEAELATPLTEEELVEMREDVEAQLERWRAGAPEGHALSEADRARGRDMWQRYEALTNSLSVELAEQLRLVLEPTLAAKLQGDYRTGKRLNMKKIIPYIASDFRKDKIWLRRTKPSTRKYQ
eukprot:1208078-Pyramimonas_sp.AAC.1